MVWAIVACVFYNFALMAPVSLLYFTVSDLLSGNITDRTVFYVAGITICLIAIAVTTYIQYNATYFSTYVESGVRRITLAEKLRRLPLSFFGKKDLSDLMSTIMADCATLETASSHWIPELIASLISTFVIALSIFAFNWKMALAALWVLPVSACIVLFSARVQTALSRRNMQARLDCADGIQECLETIRDLRANNAEDDYLKILDGKIKYVEKRSIITELGTAVFVASAQMLLKAGIATTALVGGILLANGEIDVLTFFMFLLVVSRIYDPMQMSLQNLAAIIGTNVQCERMNEILEHPIQTGGDSLSNIGYDIKFSNVAFSYNPGEPVLRDVSFTAKQGEVTALIGPSGGGKTTVSRLAARF